MAFLFEIQTAPVEPAQELPGLGTAQRNARPVTLLLALDSRAASQRGMLLLVGTASLVAPGQARPVG